MTRIQKPKAASAAKIDRRHLGVMVTQRLDEGHGPGPIRIFKTVQVSEAVGRVIKTLSLKVPLDHQLLAGTDALTPGDRRAFAEQGLSAPQIAYVETKLPTKKAASDAHKVIFETGKALRLRESLKERLIAQLSEDPLLAAAVLSATASQLPVADAQHAAEGAQLDRRTLSDKVLQLRSFIDDIGREMAAHKASAKVGRTYNQVRLNATFNEPAARAWTLTWFAFSEMVEQATGTRYARSKDWRSKRDNAQLAAACGYSSASATP